MVEPGKREKKKGKHRKAKRHSAHGAKHKRSASEKVAKDKRKRRHSSSSSSSSASSALELPTASPSLAADVLAQLLRARPEGARELRELFAAVDSGETVLLSGLADVEVRALLERLFCACGLRARGKGETGGYALEDRERTLPLCALLDAALADDDKDDEPQPLCPSAAGAAADPPSLDNGGLGDDGAEAAGPRPPPSAPRPHPSAAPDSPPSRAGTRVLGPARPPAAMLTAVLALDDGERTALAAEALARGEASGGGAAERDGEEGGPDSPDVGPALPGAGRRGQGAADRGGPGPGPGPGLAPLAWWQRADGERSDADGAAAAQPEQPSREEWMTALPSHRSGPNFAPDVARGFTRSGPTQLGDTSVWTDTPADVARKQAAKVAAFESDARDRARERDLNVGRQQQRAGEGGRSGSAGAGGSSVALARAGAAPLLAGLARGPQAPAAPPCQETAQAQVQAGAAAAAGAQAQQPRGKSLVQLHTEKRYAVAGLGVAPSVDSQAGDTQGASAGQAKKRTRPATVEAATADGAGVPALGRAAAGWDPEKAPWRPFDREKDLDPRRGDTSAGLKRALNDHVMGTLSSRFGDKGKTESSFT